MRTGAHLQRLNATATSYYSCHTIWNSIWYGLLLVDQSTGFIYKVSWLRSAYGHPRHPLYYRFPGFRSSMGTFIRPPFLRYGATRWCYTAVGTDGTHRNSDGKHGVCATACLEPSGVIIFQPLRVPWHVRLPKKKSGNVPTYNCATQGSTPRFFSHGRGVVPRLSI